MTQRTPPADADVRQLALDPTRSFIVEAPAGSGKTELLVRRYLRLLSIVEAPEQVLAITFTRKAAGEMRSRVVRALALAQTETGARAEAEQDELAQLASAVHRADSANAWHLQTHPARLRIMTIDALNAALSRQLPILSGAGGALAIAQDANALYAEVALRLIERLGGRDRQSAAIAGLLRHLDNRYELFESLLARELARREHWLDVGLMRFELPILRAQLEATLRAVVNEELAELCARIPAELHEEIAYLAAQGAAVLNGFGVESPLTACDALRAMPEVSSDALAQWHGIAELLLTDKGEWRVQINKRIGFPPEEKMLKARLDAVLKRLRVEPELGSALHLTRSLPVGRYDDAQWAALTDLLDVLKLAIAELEVVMRERGEADYTLNSIAARRALGSANDPTELALRMDQRLMHILVDEFQDTSRSQVELLVALTAGWSDGDGRTLFCVGDPMQSIYRFRHADVGLFLNLKSAGLNQLRLTPLRLTVNFRSGRKVLDWVNAAFAQALPNRDDPERGAVAFSPSHPHATAHDDGGVFVHPVVYEQSVPRETARLEEAKRVGEIVARALRERTNARIAVLVANRLHLKYIVPELIARDIRFEAQEIDPLARRPSVQDLVALTRALVHLADRVAWLAVLRAPWCGLSLTDLYALCGANDRRTVWQMLLDAEGLALMSEDARTRAARIVPILREGLRLRGRIGLRDCVERTWHALGGPATVSGAAALEDSAQYFARLEAIEDAGELIDSATLEQSLTDLYAAPASGGSVRVELMTVHRAKGLEFDVVIVPALDGGVRAEETKLLRVEELPKLGERALLLAPVPRRGADKDAIYGWLEQLDKARARLERGRLLYVAATRARTELHILAAARCDADGVKKPPINSLLHFLWPEVEAHYVAHSPRIQSVVPDEASTRTVAELRRLPLDWSPPAPSEPLVGPLRDIIEDEPLHPEFEWVSETARHVGTLVHREIERIGRLDAKELQRVEFETERDRYHIELAELGVPVGYRESACARVVAALRALLTDTRGRWLLGAGANHREAESELAVSGIVGGEVVNGVIDRTIVDADGTRWIVDFKTSTHEGGGVERFLDNEVERYRPQLRRYAELLSGLHHQPVKAALYFPLLGAWREVPFD